MTKKWHNASSNSSNVNQVAHIPAYLIQLYIFMNVTNVNCVIIVTLSLSCDRKLNVKPVIFKRVWRLLMMTVWSKTDVDVGTIEDQSRPI